MGSDFEVRWLSKGKALKRAFALREEVEQFLEKDKNSTRTHFKDMDWLTSFAYLVDVFESLNELNVSLQGSNSTILDSHGKLREFNKSTLIYNPFMSNVEDLPTDDYTIKQEFIDLINNGVLQSQLENKSLSQFWISLADMFPNLVEMVTFNYAISNHICL